MVTAERMNALLTVNREMFGDKGIYSQQQVIFLNIKFTCSGWVTKWIVGATYSSGSYYPELQIWRPSGSGTYQKLNGTFAAAAGEKNNGIYEFIVDPPLPFQPDDILGLFQPSEQNSRLLVDYDSEGDLLHLSLNSSQVEPSHTLIDVTSADNFQIGRQVPLIAVEIGELSNAQIFQIYTFSLSSRSSRHTTCRSCHNTHPGYFNSTENVNSRLAN